MEINVTHLIDEDCSQFSNSIASSGLENIGEITWRNAVECAEEKPLVTAEQQDDLREWIADFGAWTRDEIAAMSDAETNALLLQFVAWDIQEMEMFDTYEEYRAAQEVGRASSYLCRNDADENGKHVWWFCIG